MISAVRAWREVRWSDSYHSNPFAAELSSEPPRKPTSIALAGLRSRVTGALSARVLGSVRLSDDNKQPAATGRTRGLMTLVTWRRRFHMVATNGHRCFASNCSAPSPTSRPRPDASPAADDQKRERSVLIRREIFRARHAREDWTAVTARVRRVCRGRRLRSCVRVSSWRRLRAHQTVGDVSGADEEHFSAR